MKRIVNAAWAIGLSLVLVSGARAQDDPRALIEKAIKARGGAEKLEKIKAYQGKSKGTLEVMGMTLEVTIQSTVQFPDQLKTTIDLEVAGQKVTVMQGYNKSKGWMQIMANGQSQDVPLTDDLQNAFKEGIYAENVGRLVPLLKDKSYTLSTLGEVKVNNRAALGVKIASKDHKDVNIYFDKETGLPCKFDSSTVNGELREVNQEVYMSDYKDYDGLKRPSKSLIHQEGKKVMELEVLEAKFPEKIDDSEFQKP